MKMILNKIFWFFKKRDKSLKPGDRFKDLLGQEYLVVDATNEDGGDFIDLNDQGTKNPLDISIEVE